MPGSTTVWFDTEARSRLRDEPFLECWDRLLARCPWATPFQGSGFVKVWYECYVEQYSPVVLTDFDAQGELRGLLTLAKDSTARRLVVAGADQAAYQAWLARPEHSTRFMEEAWRLLASKTHGLQLTFKYLPPGLDPQSLNPRAVGAVVDSRPRERPVLRLAGPRLKVPSGKDNTPDPPDRPEQFGEVRLERVTDEEDLLRVFDEMVPYYDLRQGAANGCCPFEDDPRKKPFLAALLNVQDLLQVSVLGVGDEVASAHIGLMDRDKVYSQIFAVSPRHARRSVGERHLRLLVRELREEGFRVLDLPPEGDPWKERFADEHDTAFELTLYKGRVAALGRAVRRRSTNLAVTILKRVGIKPSEGLTLLTRIKRLRVGRILPRLWRAVRQKAEYRVYRQTWEDLQAVESEGLMNKDRVADLLKFEPSESWQTRQNFLDRALHRLENGQHVLTVVQDGKLLHHAWLVERQKKAFFSEVKSEFEYPDGAAVLYDSYTHPDARGRGLQQMSVRERLAELQTLTDVRYAYISATADNLPSRHVIEKSGFEYQCSLFYSRWLWIEARRTVEAESARSRRTGRSP